MKRTAAIVGPTPSFVRWAIRYDCPFREPESRDLPWQTFRQLRALRELSIGFREGRIIDGICLHPQFNQHAETARGFPVDEILAHFADASVVQKTCGCCPANAAQRWSSDHAHDSPSACWAGCYGWMPSIMEGLNIARLFDQMADGQTPHPLSGFPAARDAWFRIWQICVWDPSRLQVVAKLIRQVQAAEEAAAANPDLTNLRSAFESCVENELVLETELVPRGMSDGVHWQLEPHCRVCASEKLNAVRICGQCGHDGRSPPAVKRKVLGLRPYLLLKDLMGNRAAEELVLRFQLVRAQA